MCPKCLSQVGSSWGGRGELAEGDLGAVIYQTVPAVAGSPKGHPNTPCSAKNLAVLYETYETYVPCWTLYCAPGTV